MTRTEIALRGAEVVLATAAVIATVPAYGDFFAGGYRVPLAAAAGAGVLAAVPAAFRRWSTPVTVLVAIAGFLTVAAVLRRGESLTSIGDDVASGGMRMLTTGLPAAGTTALLILPALLVYAAGFGAVTVTLRTRAVLAPTPFPLLPLAGALFLTDGAFAVSVAVLVPLVILVLIRAVRRTGVTSGRYLADRARLGLPLMALIATVGVAAAHLAPIDDRDRFDPREWIRPEVTIEETVTPLAAVRSQQQEDPRRDLFTVAVSDPGIDRVRTAALDDYDGTVWTSDDRFLTAGPALPADPEPAPSAAVRLEVGIIGLDGPFLPAVGWPRRITAGRIGFCAGSGVLAAAKEDRPGLRYHLEAGVRPRDDAAGLADIDTASLTRSRKPLPTALAKAAERLTYGAPNRYAQLEALERGLRAMPYTPEAPPGHSLERLARLFEYGPDRTMGHAEQYAAAFAVLARSLGFQVRVVTGYLLRHASRTDGVYTVRTGDAWAWAEVDIHGYGWTAFDPTDERNRRPPEPPPAPAPSPTESGAVSSSRVTAVTLPPSGGGAPAAAHWFPRILAILVSLVIAFPAAVVTEKRRRRRARGRGTPAERIAGAWTQSTDRLRDAGLPIHRSWTAYETAEAARRCFGAAAAPVATLAALFSAACYGTRPPGPETADEAWRSDRALGAALRRDRGLTRTAGSWLSPASLWRGNG